MITRVKTKTVLFNRYVIVLRAVLYYDIHKNTGFFIAIQVNGIRFDNINNLVVYRNE